VRPGDTVELTVVVTNDTTIKDCVMVTLKLTIEGIQHPVVARGYIPAETTGAGRVGHADGCPDDPIRPGAGPDPWRPPLLPRPRERKAVRRILTVWGSRWCPRSSRESGTRDSPAGGGHRTRENARIGSRMLHDNRAMTEL